MSSIKTTSIENLQRTSFDIHPDLLLCNKLIFQPCNLLCTSKPAMEPESEAYGAFSLALNNCRMEFRVAKTTPTKNGHFVTLWKRIKKGPIMPYDVNDPLDLVVVCVRENDKYGQFVFPKSILVAMGVFSVDGKGGKRAIRVYAPWVKVESSQAMKTQTWQTKYFVDLSDTASNLNIEHIQNLYRAK